MFVKGCLIFSCLLKFRISVTGHSKHIYTTSNHKNTSHPYTNHHALFDLPPFPYYPHLFPDVLLNHLSLQRPPISRLFASSQSCVGGGVRDKNSFSWLGSGRLAIIASMGVCCRHLVSISNWRTIWRQRHIRLLGFSVNSVSMSRIPFSRGSALSIWLRILSELISESGTAYPQSRYSRTLSSVVSLHRA